MDVERLQMKNKRKRNKLRQNVIHDGVRGDKDLD